MKKHLMILAAIATMVCGCNKLNNSISDLEKRIDDSEVTVQVLKDKVAAFEEILNKLQAQISITSVKAVDGGFEIAFSDGSTYKVVNGKDCEVSYDEDDLCYYFDFGDGEKLAVAKYGAFGIKVENDVIEIESGKAVKVPYEVIGADKTTKVLVEDSPYTVKVNEKDIEVSIDKAVDGVIVLKAIRNSDGANSAVVLTVKKKALEDVTVDLVVESVTTHSAFITSTPSSNDVFYIVQVENAEYVNQFDDDEELVEADLDYFYYMYGSIYSEYGFSSFEQLVTEGLCRVGKLANYEYCVRVGGDYVAYAYALDEDLNLVSKEVTKLPLELEPFIEPDATYLGVANWHDGIASAVYTSLGKGGYNLDMPVDVYEDNYMPGVFYFYSPYNYVNIASWFGDTPEGMEQYVGNWFDSIICIDASNPNKVHMSFQDLGMCLDPEDGGWMSAGTQYTGKSEACTGTFADGKISFDAIYVEESLWNPGAPDLYEDIDFYITMPEEVGPTATTFKTMKQFTGKSRLAANQFSNGHSLSK